MKRPLICVATLMCIAVSIMVVRTVVNGVLRSRVLSTVARIGGEVSFDKDYKPFKGTPTTLMCSTKRVYAINLSLTQFSSADCGQLAMFPELELLLLAHVTVDDEAIPQLAKLSRLRVLNIAGSRISQRGVIELKSLLPNTQIVSEFVPGADIGNPPACRWV